MVGVADANDVGIDVLEADGGFVRYLLIGDDRDADRLRLQHRDAQSLVNRRHHDDVRLAIERRQIVDLAAPANLIRDAEPIRQRTATTCFLGVDVVGSARDSQFRLGQLGQRLDREGEPLVRSEPADE